MRYVTDVAYLPTFIPHLAPAWLDLITVVSGYAPPDRNGGARWCELGCGQGLTANLAAAMRPSGQFVGIDLMPDHVAAARRFASDAKIGNIDFHCADFADAESLGMPQFDYIVAHGVLSWIDAAAQAALERFIDVHLAPGGLLYLSYNNMVDWAVEGPFQHLVFQLAAGETGPSDARGKAAVAQAIALAAAGAPALRSNGLIQAMTAGDASPDQAYLAHEYLAPAWRPRYVDEVRQAMRRLGLAPLGSATLSDNFDSLSLGARAREALATIADPDRRDLARDYFTGSGLRRDIFGRDAAPLSGRRRQERLLETRIALDRPASLASFKTQTAAGVVRFDNPVSRTIVEALTDGARATGECRSASTSDEDLISNMLMLCCTAAILPASEDADLAAINSALQADELSTPEGVLHMTRGGDPQRISKALLAGLAEDDEARAWLAFLGRYG